jgi:parallel beta-helix repeat protein
MADIIARGIANSIGKIPNTKTWTAIDGQTVFTLSNGSYVPNKNLIEVIVESIPQISGDHYTETSSTSFTLNEPLSAGMKVYAKWYESKVPETIGHSTRHELGGNDEIDITKLKNYDVITTSLAESATLLPVPNGVDDTSVFAAALSSITSKGNGILQLARGTYTISSTLDIPSNCKIIGQNSTIKVKANSNFKLMYIHDGKENIHISGVTFDGNSSNMTNLPWMIHVYNGCTNIVFENCYWKNVSGISVVFDTNITASGVIKSRFLNCGIKNRTSGNSADRQQAVAFTGIGIGNFANHNFFNNVGLDCISFTQQSTFLADGNTIISNDAGSIYANQSHGIRVTNNYVNNVNGFVVSTSGNGIDLYQCNDIIVSNNILEKCGAAGIMVGDCNKVIIDSNIAKNNYQSGVSLHQGGITIDAGTSGFTSDDITITNNRSFDNQSTPTQKYGVHLRQGSGTVGGNIRIDSLNSFKGNLVSSLSAGLRDYTKDYLAKLSNVAKNGSFENGTLGWSAPTGTISVDNTDFVYGTQCGKTVNNGATDGRFFEQQIFDVSGGDILYLRSNVKFPSANSFTIAKLSTSSRDSANATLSGADIQTTTTKDAWVKLSGLYTVPTNTYHVRMQIQSNTTPVTNDYIKADGMVCINLTRCFGKGNEPSLVVIENLLSDIGNYFEGNNRGGLGEFVLWDGNQTATGTITLNDLVSNYDELIFYSTSSADLTGAQTVKLYKSAFSSVTLANRYWLDLSGAIKGNFNGSYSSLSIDAITSRSLKRVTGIKY